MTIALYSYIISRRASPLIGRGAKLYCSVTEAHVCERVVQDPCPKMPRPNHYSTRCASGCVVECRICNREVAGSNLGRGYFAPRSTQPSIPPGSVNEYQLRKAGMAHSDCGWTRGRAGKTVRSLENTRHTWALLRWCFTTKRRYIKCMHLYLYQAAATANEREVFLLPVGFEPNSRVALHQDAIFVPRDSRRGFTGHATLQPDLASDRFR